MLLKQKRTKPVFPGMVRWHCYWKPPSSLDSFTTTPRQGLALPVPPFYMPLPLHCVFDGARQGWEKVCFTSVPFAVGDRTPNSPKHQDTRRSLDTLEFGRTNSSFSFLSLWTWLDTCLVWPMAYQKEWRKQRDQQLLGFPMWTITQ